MNISNNINSAIVSGVTGLNRASDGITQNASNIANLSAVSAQYGDPKDVLANATLNQLSTIKQTLPQASEGITSNLVGLSVNLNNAQASAKVVDTANSTVGTILDILA